MGEGQLQSSPGGPGGPGGPVQAKSLSAQQGAPGMPGQPGVMTASGSPGMVPVAGMTNSTPTMSPGGNPVATALDPSYSTSNPFAVAPQMNDEDPRQNRYWRDRFGSDTEARGPGIMNS